MWITKNYKSEPVTWYSEEEYNKLKAENEQLQEENENLKIELGNRVSVSKQLENLQKLYSKQYQINENKGYLRAEQALDEIEKYCENFGCKNCIESKRCKEKQDNKSSLINYLIMQIGEVEGKPTLIQNLKNAIPNITRCDIAIIKKILQIINSTKGEK